MGEARAVLRRAPRTEQRRWHTEAPWLIHVKIEGALLGFGGLAEKLLDHGHLRRGRSHPFHPGRELYPTPMDAAGNDDVLVGRIRSDSSLPGGLAFWTVTDSIRKGAATNVLQVIQEAASRSLIRR